MHSDTPIICISVVFMRSNGLIRAKASMLGEQDNLLITYRAQPEVWDLVNEMF